MSLLLLWACSGGFPGQATLAQNPHELFGLLAAVEVEDDASVWIEDLDGQVLSPPVPLAAGQAASLPVRGLPPESTQELVVVAGDGARSRATQAFELELPAVPADWPACQLTVPDDAGVLDDDAVICTNGVLTDERWGMVYCVDRSGQPRWAVEHPGGAQLRVLEPTDGGGFASVSMSTGKVSLFDARGELWAEHNILRFADQARFAHDWIDPHEVIELAEGPWAGALALLTVSTDTVRIEGEAESRLGYGILVVDPATEQVLWDWSAHGELGDDLPIDPALDYARLGPSASYATDFMHGNALVHRVLADGSQRFTMSLRHQDWLIDVDVDSDAIAWTLGYEGDFTLVDDLDAAEPQQLARSEWFYAQHSPAWVEAGGERPRLLLFDNGHNRPDSALSYSRVVELELDLDRGLAAPRFTWGSAEDGAEDHFFAIGGGDVDLLPDGRSLLVLKGWDAAFAAVLSYPDGALQWRYDCPDADDYDEPYRARYASDLYALDGWGQ